MYNRLKEAADYIKSNFKDTPKVGVILGSGLGSFVEKVESPTILSYSNIPYFIETTVEGHEGRMILGQINGVSVAILQGRIHAYEGLDMDEVVFPLRALALSGIESLILTNASGGINKSFKPGQLVLIKDHINLMGKNPLIGPNISELGSRFPDMSDAYSLELRKNIIEAAGEMELDLASGVYAGVLGPTYETPSEVNMLRILGADMVGMSTVPESIAANHLGLKVSGISCVTNMAAGIENKKLNHSDVKKEALKVMDLFSTLLCKSIEKMGGKND